MRLTAESEYAIHLVDALNESGKRMTIRELSEACEINRTFAMKICHKLTNAGIFSSKRGVDGGVEIKRGRDITALDVLEAVGDRNVKPHIRPHAPSCFSCSAIQHLHSDGIGAARHYVLVNKRRGASRRVD